MTSAPGSRGRTVVLVAGGASWEGGAVDAMSAPGSGLTLLRRALDLNEALALASTGGVDLVAVSADAPGLDADCIALLTARGAATVAILGATGESARERERLERIGVRAVLVAGHVEDLVRGLRGVDPDQGVPRQPASHPTDVPSPGRLVAVWGPTGGPGRTTLAVNLAAELAVRGRGTLLLDVDPYGGAVAEHLALLEEVSGLLAAARAANAGSLSPESLAGLAREVRPGLRVLTGLPRPQRWSDVRAAAYDVLLSAARELDEVVVADTGFGLDEGDPDPFSAAGSRDAMTLATIAEADQVVVVAAADPVGLTRLARALVDLAHVRPEGPTVVAVNRMRPGLGWTRGDLEDLVARLAPGAPVAYLPDDRRGADRALVAGRTLRESGDGSLRRAVAGLADLLEHNAGALPVASRGRRRLLLRR